MSNKNIGALKSELDTPCLVIEYDQLKANISRLQSEANIAGKKVRPHAKTHKCPEICKLQIEAGASGIAVAKVSEAVILAELGFKNTLITSPVVTATKIANLLFCAKQDPELTVVIDNIANAKMINSLAQQQHLTVNVLIDIDPGIGRTGITNDQVVTFAQSLRDLTHLQLRGIQCYAGNLQHITDYAERFRASTTIMNNAADTLHQLNRADFNCNIVTGSGTGTYAIDMQISEVTEIQPGSYTVMDAEYASIINANQHSLQQHFLPALRLLTTVISANRTTHVTCDAGWKALYQVATKPLILNPCGYAYDWGGFGDEHGKITAIDDNPLPALGDKLEMVVAHCDPTINMYDEFYVIENNRVRDVWPISMRGKSQ